MVTAVDTLIGVAAMLVSVANCTSTVRDESSALCALLRVVIPVSILTVQCWKAGRGTRVAVSINAAVARPDADGNTVNLVLLQPLVIGVGSCEEKLNSGNTITSLSESGNSLLRINESDIDEGAEVTGL